MDTVNLTGKIKKVFRAFFFTCLPTTLIYFVTNKCDLSCQHCFYRKSLGSAAGDLTLDEVRNISASLKGLNNLLLSGGEPFLRKDIDEIVETFYKNNNLKFCLIPTNGSSTETIIKKTKNILDNCPNMNLTVLVSLDGLETTHNRIREGAHGPGRAFQNALYTLSALRELQKEYPKLMLVVNSVVHKRNVNEISELARFIKNNFGITLGLSMYRDTGIVQGLQLSLAEWVSIRKSLHEENRKNESAGLLLRFFYVLRDEYADYLNENFLLGKAGPLNCVAGRFIAVLDHNGDVKVCENYKAFAALGDYGFDFKRLWSSPQRKNELAKIKKCFCIHPCFVSTSLTYSLKNYFLLLGFRLSKILHLPFPDSKKQIFYS
jgi:MoaA/NifB/PqqE/SkfB family radical SAM enzyme